MKTSTCPQCGKIFSYHPSSYPKGKVHCSRKCQGVAAKAVTNCPTCGKEFEYYKSWPRIYCSNKCSASVNARKNFGKYAEGVGFTEKTCDNCGKSFMKATRDLKKTKGNFCGLVCYGIWKSKNIFGKNHPRHKQVDLICKQCGKSFTRAPHWLKAGWGKFCSRKCKAVWQSESGEFSGEKNHAWLGGRVPYYGENWTKQKRNARARDKYTCQRCGKTENELGQKLDVHHRKRFKKFGIELYKEANSLDNLVSLCRSCHKIVEHNGL